MEQQRRDIGAVKRLKVLCISETGWFESDTLLADIDAAGGFTENQYTYGWPPFGDLHPHNAGGSATLVEFEALDGTTHTFLMDTGWSNTWMEQRFKEEGIDTMLQQGTIEFLVMTHEHFDHLWGIATTLKYRPDLTIYVNDGFYQEGYDLLKQAGHTGALHVVKHDEPLLLFPGVALVNFDLPIICRVQGENVLYFNLQDKGICTVTGCGHPGILNILEYARTHFTTGDSIYGVYGGLHIAPFEQWKPELDDLVQTLAGYNIPHWGCNHCTGQVTVRKMLEAGIPVKRGTARHGSKTDLYLGNGDSVEF